MPQPIPSGPSMTATPAASVLLFLAASFLGAWGSYLYKSGADRADGTAAGFLANPRLLGGAGCYLAVMCLFVAAYRRGGSLAVLYPVYASTFLFAALISWWAYGTPVRPVNAAGMLLIVGGMYLMGRS